MKTRNQLSAPVASQPWISSSVGAPFGPAISRTFQFTQLLGRRPDLLEARVRTQRFDAWIEGQEIASGVTVLHRLEHDIEALLDLPGRAVGPGQVER